MRKTHLYVLAFAIAALAIAAVAYKWQVLKFPLQPASEVEVWTVQARVEYQAARGPNSVTLQVPEATPGWTVIDQRFVARDYTKLEQVHDDGREVQWTRRRAVGPQFLYYRATVVRADDSQHVDLDLEPIVGTPAALEEPYATAAQTLLDQVREGSADIVSYARTLIARFDGAASEGTSLLAELFTDDASRSRFLADLLAVRQIPARVIQGIQLDAGETTGRMQTWLMVYDGTAWITIDPRTGAIGWPRDLFLWSARSAPLLTVNGTPRESLEFAVSLNLADAMAIAERRLEVRDDDLVRYSLLSLPLQSQQVYQVLLMVPLGAFMMLILRNLIGVKTFGTFMPVLVALAFRETGLVAGLFMFGGIVSAGLLIRFYLERLRLLLVPRLTAVLIIVVLLMAALSVLTNRLGIEVGLSVALFPMVILAMTIERMSVAWDERGAGTAIKEGLGTLLVAALAYLVMSWPPLEHIVFVFPETLLILFACTLLLGRYSGYRLSELFRFRALAREPDPITPPPAADASGPRS
ncbi:inactive transglutaminase family protein [Coralloluteibacterium stylophorae]|uniref:Inactive transglutaminase family protein n=1 Tax=Coralloluteibacterium stylophorae TaxID=1776034 RepID=A0A8J7VUT9_9GAMM|nr:inactive transglutaminase family protein [Coralloluteibacterium stylophorae]MBS7458956.1 inactive transglutaminase family protein [Coralloluteibacterium stylophorae]